jgi:heme exporter protein C
MWLPLLTFIWVTAGTVIAWLMPPAVDPKTGMQLQATAAAFYHVPIAVTMNIAFVLSALFGAGWLRGRKVESDLRSVAYAEIGFWFGIIALVTGAVWAKINWGAYWSWDPQQVGIVATLLTYAGLFSLRHATEDEQKQRNFWAVYAILGVISAIFWTYAFRHLASFSLHPSRPLTESAPLFKFALRFNIVGMFLVLMWIANIRVRLATIQEKLHNRELKEMQWVSS